jgi:hypothetical protein
MTISASMVFRRSEDDRPCLATQTWWRARIRYAHDLVQWHEHRSQVCVCNAETSIHQRLKSALVQGGIRISCHHYLTASTQLIVNYAPNMKRSSI